MIEENLGGRGSGVGGRRHRDNLVDPLASRPAIPPEDLSLSNLANAESGTEMLPHSLSGVFDEAFDIYKRHFKPLLLVVALLYFPTQIALHAVSNTWLHPLGVQLNAEKGMPDSSSVMAFLFGSLLIGAPEYGIPGLLALVVLVVTSGLVCVLLSDIYLGRPYSIRSAYRRTLPNLFRLVCAWSIGFLAVITISVILLFGVLFVVGMIVLALVNQLGPLPATLTFFAGLLLNYILCMAFVARFYLFTTQLIVEERLPLSGVWERNWQLIGPVRFRRTWLAAVLLPLMVFGLQYLILFSVDQAADLIAGFLHLSQMAVFVIVTVSTACVILFFQPYPMIFTTLLYYDYRIRREGLDIRLMVENREE